MEEVINGWTILEKFPGKKRMGRARCICGNVKEVTIKNIYNGKSKTCGCRLTDTYVNEYWELGPGHMVDGEKRKYEYICKKCGISIFKRRGRCTAETRCPNCWEAPGLNVVRHKCWMSWHDMHRRCKMTHRAAYQNYGGRGISVCKEWDTFEPFREWAYNNGFDISLSIDRIDNNGNYEPSNCRWVTSLINAQNTRATKLSLEKAQDILRRLDNGERGRDLAQEYDVAESVISRIKKGQRWSNAQQEKGSVE